LLYLRFYIVVTSLTNLLNCFKSSLRIENG
jgi:hypothetical protein